MAKSSASKSVESLIYEQALKELEGIVAALENEQRSLDESMALYERGQALVKRCTKILDKAELKVKQLSGDTLSDFEEAE
jgi:exodeoxyribonuclease VII small subunit